MKTGLTIREISDPPGILSQSSPVGVSKSGALEPKTVEIIKRKTKAGASSILYINKKTTEEKRSPVDRCVL
jgi:hypothetical protein